ncbi:MAG: D-aminoacyl-tRNA deacylase [Acidimicrobiia bacterium]|nr:MAG: D-aminoacyl-tRNA deacylase [Acidimicrobiia bacterium]
MRAVVQRVSRAQVRVDGVAVSSIGPGLCAFVGVEKGDTEADVAALADKLAGLRVFSDPEGRMNLDIYAVGGSLLVVSQFTLAADLRRGRRPSFDRAAPPEEAERLLQILVDRLRSEGLSVATGVFGAVMEVDLVNQGPVTFVIATSSGRVV